MATVPERIHDVVVRHRISLSRYSNTLVRQMLALLNRTEKSVMARLAEDAGETLQGQRLTELLTAVREIQAEGWVQVRPALDAALTQLGGVETDFAHGVAQMAAKGVGVELSSAAPAVDQVMGAVRARPFQGRLLKEWLAGAEAGAAARVREAIRQGFVEGETTDQIVRKLRGTRAAQYRDGLLEVSRRGAEAMVRTAITHTSTVAHQKTWEAHSDVIVGLIWTSTLDNRTSHVCIARSEQVFPIDKGPRPPAHINCLVADSHVTAGTRITGAFKRWYDGDVVVIRTAGGKKLTCTPNHPVLTDHGWIAAGLLNVGGHVVCDAGIKRVPLVDGDDENVEARIEDAAEALFAHQQMATVPVPTAAEDFHGDGVDGEVAIVATDRRLQDRCEPTDSEHLREFDLDRRSVGLPLMAGEGGLGPLGFSGLSTSNGLVGSAGHGAALLGSGASHPGALLFAAGAGRMAPGGEMPLHSVGSAVELPCDAGNAYAGQVEALGLIGVDHHADRTANPHVFTRGDEAAQDGLPADAKLAADLIGGLAGAVALDEIVQIEWRNFAGHVFNLETVGGWYVAEGIVTHNCRSTMRPKVRDIEGVAPMKTLSYSEWLKRQPVAVQDDILGPARGALFRTGGFTVDRFVDDAGKTLTLAQLRQRDAAGFRESGLDLPLKPPPGVPKDEIAKFLADPGAQKALLTKLWGGETQAEHHLRRSREIGHDQGWKARDTDMSAIRYYTGSGYEGINRRMREGGFTLEDRQFTMMASRATDELPQEAGPVWRAPSKRHDTADRFWERAVAGEPLDLGSQMQSFSRDREVATTWSGETRLLLEIRNPGRGAYIEPLSLNPGEEEVLFPLGLTYRVVEKRSDVRDGRIYRTIVLEVVD